MASQGYAIGALRRRPSESSILAGRMKGLAGMVANQQQAQMIAREDAYRNKLFEEEQRQSREEMKLKRQQQKQLVGLEMGKSAVALGTSDFIKDSSIGGMTLGSLGSKIGLPGTKGGFFSDISLGGIAAGGLGGYGLSSMFGAKGTGKKLLYGGLGGAALGLLSGGFDWSNLFGGALGGILGGALS